MSNQIKIFAPRWKDRTVLVAEWKIGATNDIAISCRKTSGELYYPEKFTVTSDWLKRFPTEQKPYGTMRIVPLDDLLNTGAKIKP